MRSHKKHMGIKDYIHMTDIWNDEGDSINSKKKIMLAKVNQELVHPPHIYDPNFIECTAPMQPLEFYDNEDGYWDGYIQQKEKNRAGVPLPHCRPHYKH